MIDTNNEEGRDPVRKTLRSLPQMHASENFEHRLKQLIAEEKVPSRPMHRRLLVRRYVPAYAFSIMTLAAAATAFYLLRSTYTTQEMPPEGKGNGVVTAKDSSSKPPGHKPESFPTPATRPESAGSNITKHLPPRTPRQDQLEEFLKEVGGTGTRPAGLPGSPFLQSQSDSSPRVWRDSTARADSVRMDSLRRLLNRQQQEGR